MQRQYTCKQCGKPFERDTRHAYQYCSPQCYYEWKRADTPTHFWEHVDMSGGPANCWPWTASRDEDGYGQCTSRKGGMEKSHRVAYELAVGPIPDGMDIMHSCDNRPCCNPSHLSPGTRTQNNEDMKAKDRHAYGERTGNAKLTQKQVDEIRRLCETHALSQAKIAKRFGIGPMEVSRIKRYQRWAHD